MIHATTRPVRDLRFLLPGIAWMLVACSGSTDETSSTSNASDNDAPRAIFDDVVDASGITFRHENGHVDRYLMPENVPGGAALFDMDDDGDLDVYLVQSGNPVDPTANTLGNELYENLGDFKFRDVTESSGTGDTGFGQGTACADYDNDGDVDLYVTNLGPNVLYRNNGNGTFTDVTNTAGVGDDRWGTSTTFLDYDKDGDVDLYVCNYINWSLEREQDCFNKMGSPDYCAPKNYSSPGVDVLYRNEGDGTFTDVTTAAGITSSGNGLGVSSVDFDDDGWLDIFVANDQLPDQLWMNQRDGTFVDEANIRGCAVDSDGIAKAGMGVTAADIDDDGDFDVLVCNLSSETDSMYINDNGRFDDATLRAGLGATSKQYTRFGMGWIDFDNDTRLDLYQANGRVARVPKTWSDYAYAEPNLLYMQSDSGRFEGGVATVTSGETPIASSRAAAFGDLDSDGRMDIVVVNQLDSIHLLRNVADDAGNWLMIRVLNDDGADALNARVEVETDAGTFVRDVRPGYSYLASNDPRVHVGIGDATSARRITVTWLDGHTRVFENVAGNQVHTFTRSD
ncbi:MAG: CRTAC1 family protein [Planctomycetota bacterium]